MQETVVEINYKIRERSNLLIEKHGSIDNCISVLEEQLNEFEDSWSLYSSECLGHGITCTRLLINWLNRMKDEKEFKGI